MPDWFRAARTAFVQFCLPIWQLFDTTSRALKLGEQYWGQTPHGYIRGFVNCPRVRGGCCKPIQGLTSLSQGVQLGYNPTGYRAILGAKI